MILNKGQNNQVIEIGVGDTKRNVGVSTNNVDKLKYLLSEGLYKNPIHSTVREICI